MTPLQISHWGALTALGNTADGFGRLCEGASGLVPPGSAAIPWLDGPAGRDLLGPVGVVSGSSVELLQRLLADLDLDPVGLAILVATTGGASADGESAVGESVRGLPVAVPEALWWGNLPHHLAEQVARDRRASGPCMVVSTACTSGTVAVGVAADLVAAGRARRALVIGVDTLCRTSLFGFRSLGVYAEDACRPFDAARSGMCVGAGAAYVVLEPMRGDARFELLGVGVAQDAGHLTAPDPAGAQLARAIARSLGTVPPARVDHVNAHGTGTVSNDATEAVVLPGALPNAAVSATKGATGHTLGAAGVVELVFLLQSMTADVIPPVVGLREPIGSVDVAATLRHRAQEVGVSVNLAFGGHNAAVAVRRVAERIRPRPARGPTPGLSATIVRASSWTHAGRDADPTTLPAVGGRDLLALPVPDLARGRVSAANWRRMSRVSRLAVAACEPFPVGDLQDAAIVLGLSGGEYTSGVNFLRSYFRSPALSSPLAFQGTVHNAPAAHLSIEMGLRGWSETILAGPGTFWSVLERALARLQLVDERLLVVLADELTPEVEDGLRGARAGGAWGEAAGAFLLARDGPGPRLTWHDGEAPPDAWGRAQAWPGGVAGAPAFAWDRAFGLGAGAEAAALVALAQRTGALAGPGVWVEVG